MKSAPKLIRQYLAILLFSTILLPVLNLAFFMAVTSRHVSDTAPWRTAKEAAQSLQKNADGYIMPDEIMDKLHTYDAWAVLIDDDNRTVVWQTPNLPAEIPTAYTLSDISGLTRGYIADYPTFTGGAEDGLLVIGFPKDSFWKDMSPTWDYNLIKNAPKLVLTLLLLNVSAIFLLYLAANFTVLRSVKPITDAIKALPAGEAVYLPEKGLLSEVAADINRTSEVLQSQNYQLRRRETARANWISGVSHDIRTPLSMVMGYAGQLKESPRLNAGEQQKVSAIVKQSERIRDLINDLNLASKLEYHMQPIQPAALNLVAIARQVVVDFINAGLEDKYSILWETEETLTACPVTVDKNLIRRALNNLIQNSINHNEQGCNIFVSVTADQDNTWQSPQRSGTCSITVSDDGRGITDEQIDRLNHTPHYMFCNENTAEQRHGLGLLIVKQITTVHGGSTTISRRENGGFSVRLTLPSA